MKISRIVDMHANAGWRVFSFLKIETDAGLVGWSEYNESYGSKGLTAVPPAPFECPSCDARYVLVRAEADGVLLSDRLTCRSCEGPLSGHDGRFILKYFFVDRPKSKPQPLLSARRTRTVTRRSPSVG
jgi:hypothetical protein